MKLLILKPSSLGDIIHALPVLRLIKRQRPNWQVHWWIAQSFAPLLQSDPDLAAVHPFQRRGWGTPAGLARGAQQLGQLHRERFDVVLDLQGLARSAAFGWISRAGFTIGLHQHREGAAAAYDISVERPSPHAHAVDWCRAVLPHLGLENHDDFEWMPPRDEPLPEGCDPGRRWLALCPGARWDNKRWPTKSFETLTRNLLMEQGDLRVVVLGGEEDSEIGARLGAIGARCVDKTGQTTLPEMVEWIRSSEAMVTNDTGPMHVAAALGKPVVALFGPTDPRRTGPYHARGTVLQATGMNCVPCLSRNCTAIRERDCLRGIGALEVSAVVQKLLAHGE
ncbi:MAG: glycosyltransferase family 9 protein [Verrucomicrobia subdivision 3 bacterium]|nr:glycosyltransferase family 9 protein [Limisphaerales bacterium]